MVYCNRCDRSFSTSRALERHQQDSSRHNICSDCDMDFEEWVGLKEHWVQSPRHAYCQHCDTHFNSQWALKIHYDRNHFYCRMHGKIFQTQNGLRQHFIQHSEHYYCQICNKHFDDNDDYDQHSEDYHYPCGACNKVLRDATDLINHKDESHWYCRPCDRIFGNENSLDHHLQSSIHQARNIRCPGCARSFIKNSDLLKHLEAGTCASGVNRSNLNNAIIRRDRNNCITKPRLMITDSPRAQETTMWATERSYNSYRGCYECFLCHRGFSTLPSLNKHLQSPQHLEKIYRCPKGTCAKEFAALSGLCEHAEFGSCGVMQFRAVRDAMDYITNGLRTITL